MKTLKILSLAATLIVTGASASSAASIQFAGDVYNQILPSNFSLPSQTGLNIGTDQVRVFSGNNGGLKIEGEYSSIKFEYLGTEAAYSNKFKFGGDLLFRTKSTRKHSRSEVGDTEVFNIDATTNTDNFTSADGFLNFMFKTDNGTKRNWSSVKNGYVPSAYSIGFAALSELSAIILFGDGTGDSDFDDMAVRMSITPLFEGPPPISAVPLPASVWMFGAALGGIGFLSRRKKGQTA